MFACCWNITSQQPSTDIFILESVQKYFSKRLLCMESLTYDEYLVALKFPLLSCRLNRSLHPIIQNYALTD